MLAIQAEEGEGSGSASGKSHTTTFHAQPYSEEWKGLTTTAASLDAAQASGGSPRCQEATGGFHCFKYRSGRGVLALETDLRDLEDSSNLVWEDDREIDQDMQDLLWLLLHIVKKINLEIKLGVFSAAKVLADAAKNVHTYTRRRRVVSTGSGRVSTASRLFSTAEESVSTAGASMPVSTAEWEDIQATIEIDEELAQRIQAEEREKYSEAEKARLLTELINKRKRYFAQQRAEERRNKPLTQAQPRTYMSNYINHMGSHTLQQLKRLSFDELKALFETTMRRVQTFHPIESDGDKTVPELTNRSSKRDAKVESDHEDDDDSSSGEGLLLKALQSNIQSLSREVYSEDIRRFWRIIRDLVKERFSTTEPTDDKEKKLWVKLKRLFELDSDDTLWKIQSWREDGYCNGGNLPGAYIVGNTLRYQSLEWYDALKDSELKEEALRNKAIMEGLINEDVESNNEDNERYELCGNETHDFPVCNIRRFEMIKYSFGQDEEYVAVKENEYEDLMSTSEDAWRAYH
ncbi:hypothetical protein Tco_0382832 [Tanacetum coccineum]